MRIDVITLFPEILRGALDVSILKRAQSKGLVQIYLHQLREYALDKHRTVDDRPFGGGPGMLLKCEPMFRAVEAVRDLVPAPTPVPDASLATEPFASKTVLFSAGGRLFDQSIAREWSKLDRLILICGHYEGVDERIREQLADEEISIGNYVLTNGALPALVSIDAVVRLIPNVVGNAESTEEESFSGADGDGESVVEWPQYTRPEEFRGSRVPEVLLGGNHAEIRAWRKNQAALRTRRNRADLLPPQPPAPPAA